MSLMKTVNIQEARKDLVRLLEEAAKGEPFVVSQEGKPSLKVVTVEEIDPVEASTTKRRIGELDGQFFIPDDMDEHLDKEIEDLFYGVHK